METAAASAINLQDKIQGVGGAFTLTIIAFTIVFLVLGGLTGIIYGIKYMAAGFERKQTGAATGGTPAPSPAAPSTATERSSTATPSPAE